MTACSRCPSGTKKPDWAERVGVSDPFESLFMLKPIALLALTLVGITGASAASGDAWAEFAAEVETACLAATADYFPDGATATVDPFGSESFGLAIVSSHAVSVICVFDKQTKAVEIGGELPVTVTAAEG
jgi:hypothetical protein